MSWGEKSCKLYGKCSEATEQNCNMVGTYGFIKGASGFIIGCTERNSEDNLEDYGYIMERIILFATSIELGTCWLVDV